MEELTGLSLNQPIKLFIDHNTDVARSLHQEFVRIRANRENDRLAIIAGNLLNCCFLCMWRYFITSLHDMKILILQEVTHIPIPYIYTDFKMILECVCGCVWHKVEAYLTHSISIVKIGLRWSG